MKVVAVVMQKGGSGKTTLARNLAVALGPRVAMLDTDPQGSLTSWFNRRQAVVPPLVPFERVTDTVADIRATGEVDVLVIDTAPTMSPRLAEVVGLTDLCLIPIRPSPDDLDAVTPALELIEGAGKPFVFVISAAKTRSKLLPETVSALAQHGRVCPAVLHDRVDFTTAALAGLGVTEMAPDSAAAAEMIAVMQYVLMAVEKAK